MIRFVLFIVALTCLSGQARAQLRATALAIRVATDDWVAGRYQPAYQALAAVRAMPYGRTIPVDYMLGTSACKIGRVAEGRQLLANASTHYRLSSRARRLFAIASQRCVTLASSLEPLPGMGSNSGGYGKTFYWADSRVPVSNNPAETVAEIPAHDLQARLLLRGAQPTAPNPAWLRGCQPSFGEALILCSTSPRISPARIGEIVLEVDTFLRFLESSFGIERADEYVTIRLVPDLASLRRAARTLHGIRISNATIAYSFQDDLSAAAVTRGGSGSILHEVTHLAMRREFGDAPQWFEEGLASLYEVSVRCGAVFEGRDNWRGELLRRAWPLQPTIGSVLRNQATVGESNRAYDEGPGATTNRAYGEAKIRYFMMYLQERGLLTSLYDALRNLPLHAASPTETAAVVRRVTGQNEEDLEAAVKALVFAQPGGGAPTGCRLIDKDLPSRPDPS